MHEQPTGWVCFDCGKEYGYGMPEGHVCTAHIDTCAVCGEEKTVTEASNFGWLKPEWQQHRKAA